MSLTAGKNLSELSELFRSQDSRITIDENEFVSRNRVLKTPGRGDIIIEKQIQCRPQPRVGVELYPNL
jgi:hypothetical protein